MTAKLIISEHDQLGGLANDDHVQYLLIDGSRAMTGNLTIQNTAPGIIFDDTTAGEDNYSIRVDGDTLIIANDDNLTDGYIRLDHPVDLFPSVLDTALFTTNYALYHQPTMLVGAVSGHYVLLDNSAYTGGGVFSNVGVINSVSTFNTTAPGGSLYLFVSQMVSTSSTLGVPPSSYRSFDHRGIIQGDGVAVGTVDICAGLADLGSLRAINNASITLAQWMTVGVLNFASASFGVISATAGAVAIVTNKYGLYFTDAVLAGDGGTETLVNQYALWSEPLTTATTINCGVWLGNSSGATNNYGVVLDGDNAGSGIWFGDGQDANIYYDGTDLLVNTNIVAASDLVLNCGTDKTLKLAESVWEDLRVALTAGKVGATNPPTFVQFMDDGAGSFGVFAWSFADEAVAGNEEQMWFAVQVPHGYKEGTDLYAHIHWSPAVSGAAGEFVKWGLEYTWINIDGTFGNTTIITSDASGAGTATTSGDGTLTADKHYKTNIGGIAGAGKTISSMLVCRVFRNSSHADDDLSQAAFAFEMDFHYQIDTMGSRQGADIK